MKLKEYEGKNLFAKYGIDLPKSTLIEKNGDHNISLDAPVVLKAQILSGDRKKHGGIIFIEDKKSIDREIKKLFAKSINGEKADQILIEEKIDSLGEYYASISYDTNVRGPVIALSKSGGSGIKKAKTFSVDIRMNPIPGFLLREILVEAGFNFEDVGGLSKIIQSLWKLFLNEYALLAEINPIFKTKDGEGGFKFIAGDAKVILDDEKVNPNEKRFVSMGGDIAILASGGGASMLNIDSLLEYGGKPANYTEYSGNPKADVVKNLTKKVLEQEGINGLWVIGGTANFTDIYETMSGFIEGLESLPDKPRYPILIRRDGPRQMEARALLEKFAADKGYDMHIYGSELSMHESAKMIVGLAGKYEKSKKL